MAKTSMKIIDLILGTIYKMKENRNMLMAS